MKEPGLFYKIELMRKVMKDEYFIAVAGCRNFYDYDTVKNYLDYVLQNLEKQGNITILHGACPTGVDQLAGRYSREKRYKCIEFPADWSLGNIGAFHRNSAMVAKSTHIVAFWDGISKGTKMTIDLAKRAKKPLKIKIISI